MSSVLRHRGFSLVEVLIAILVLALGLLGLGAIFPVVISQQRDAVDATQGEVVASTAESLLRGNSEIGNLKYLAGNRAFGKRTSAGIADYEYEWVAAWPTTPGLPLNQYSNWPSVPTFNLQTGAIVLQDIPAGNGNDPTTDAINLRTVPLGARLYPQPHSGEDPRFVWDFVARREPTQDAVQVAIIVRRIDARLPVPRNKTLSDVLTGSNATDVLLPVGIGQTGRPTPSRPGQFTVYSMPQFLGVYVDEDKLDRFYFTDTSGATDTSREFVRKVGQKLLDNTGVVRTVVGVDKDDANGILVDPPFVLANAGEGAGVRPTNLAERASWVRQIVFTPETPVAVRVFTIGDDS
ncbi:MAG: prepilin-type N-terminal cleavage/methylation domain-containing protein [Phycisphaerales bacterium]|nr:prepilin-type N-terminal cleavage/methylation domain-containing protein [Phycisphaerales bacterium]